MSLTIALDCRPLQDRYPTGIATYTQAMRQAWLGRQDVRCISLTVGRRQQLLAGGEQVHQSLPGKVFNLASALGLSVSKPQAAIDYYLLPHPTPWPKNRKPYIVTIHDVAYLERPYYYSWRQRLWHRAIHTRQLLEQATGLICVSEATKQRLWHLYPQLTAKPLVVIPEGLTVSEAKPVDVTKVKGGKLPARYLLYVGTIEPRKNIASLIKAFDLVRLQQPDLALVLAGKYGWSSRDLRRQIQQHPAVYWLNYVTPEEKSYLLQQSQALVWPSWYEGFGFPPLEAAYWGKLVITSWSTSLPELLGHQAIYCNPYNYSELAAVITQVLRRPAQPETKQINYLEWSVVAERTLAFIQSLHENSH